MDIKIFKKEKYCFYIFYILINLTIHIDLLNRTNNNYIVFSKNL